MKESREGYVPNRGVISNVCLVRTNVQWVLLETLLKERSHPAMQRTY